MKAHFSRFFADWCGPCKMIAPLLINLSAEREDLKIVKVDADNASELLAIYTVFVVYPLYYYLIKAVLLQLRLALSR